jgi:hypothetical protein
METIIITLDNNKKKEYVKGIFSFIFLSLSFLFLLYLR